MVNQVVQRGMFALAPLFSIGFSLPLLPLLLKRALSRMLGLRIAEPVPASDAVTAALSDPRWGKHGYVEANGVRFHYVERGPPGAPGAPLLLFLHGFPECWYSWRHQLAALGDTYRCVALDLRGYGWSSKPQAKAEYALETLVRDVGALITALGADRAVLVAHDWGGNCAHTCVCMYVRPHNRSRGTPHTPSRSAYRPCA